MGAAGPPAAPDGGGDRDPGDRRAGDVLRRLALRDRDGAHGAADLRRAPAVEPPRAARRRRRAQPRRAEASGRIVEFAQLQPVLRAYGRAGERHALLDDALVAQHAARRRQLWQMSIGLVASSVAVQLAFLVVMVLGVDLALGGSIDVPELVALLVLVARFGQPLVEAADIVGALRVAQGSLSGLRRVLDVAPLPEPAPPRRASPAAAALRLRGVRFSYGEHTVLDGIDLDVAPRTMLALVGRSGRGQDDGRAARRAVLGRRRGQRRDRRRRRARDDAPRRSWRSVAMVFQDVYLFDATIAENIRAGRPDASDAEVREAARLAARGRDRRAAARRLGHAGRRGRRRAVGRRAPARLDRARDPQGRADRPARRGDRRAGSRERGGDRARARGARRRQDARRHRPPAGDGRRRRPDRGARRGAHRRSAGRTPSCSPRAGSTPTSGASARAPAAGGSRPREAIRPATRAGSSCRSAGGSSCAGSTCASSPAT